MRRPSSLRLAVTGAVALLVQSPCFAQSTAAAYQQSADPSAEESVEQSFEVPQTAPPYHQGPLASRYKSDDQAKPDARLYNGDPLTAPGMVSNAASISGAAPASVMPGQPMYYVYEFGAKWCPSCRDLAPFVLQLASKYQGFAQVIPVDIDTPSAKPLVQKLGLRAVPTVIISDRQGNQLQTLVGLQQGLKLDKILNGYRRRAASGASSQ